MSELPASPDRPLLGEWRMKDAPACAQKYPASVTFAAGTYRGTRDRTQGFVWWDAGIYRIEHDDGGDTLVLSDASDALVRYRIVLREGEFDVVDPEGCRLTYSRIHDPG